MYRILIAEDEKKLRDIVRDYFQNKGFQVETAADGKEALDILKLKDFDLVLLDVMMPRLDGFAVCKALRKAKDIPVIFLTAKTAEEDQLKGFEAKADDYIIKPFSLPVLHAKVNAMMDRYKGRIPDGKILHAEGIEVDLEKRQVKVDGQTISLPPKVYDLLVCLMENKNRILSRQQLLDQVWGQDVFCYDRAVDTAIKKLRHALGNRAGCIRTIVKVGYKFQERTNE